jgi:hypothetical protein
LRSPRAHITTISKKGVVLKSSSSRKATPPSIAIEALVLGGPESVRVVCFTAAAAAGRLRNAPSGRYFGSALAFVYTSTGDGGFPIQIGGGFLYNTYPNVSCMYLACISHVFRCVPFRYIKIHRDTTRYICICHFGYHMKCILPRDMYPSLRYIKDTFRIQCILTLRYMAHKIHSRYMSDT